MTNETAYILLNRREAFLARMRVLVGMREGIPAAAAESIVEMLAAAFDAGADGVLQHLCELKRKENL